MSDDDAQWLARPAGRDALQRLAEKRAEDAARARRRAARRAMRLAQRGTAGIELETGVDETTGPAE